MQNAPELLFLINHQRSVTSFKPLIRAPLSSLKRGDRLTHSSGGTEGTPRIQFTVKHEKSSASLFRKTIPSHLPQGIQRAFQSNQAQTTDLSLSPIIRKQPGKQHSTKSFQVLFPKPARVFYPEQAILLRLLVFKNLLESVSMKKKLKKIKKRILIFSQMPEQL